MNLPMVWDGSAYTRALHPASLSVSQTLKPLSTASMTLPPTDEINNLDWVQITTPDGTVEYYRVTSVSIDTRSGAQSVYLEHGACTLGDTLLTTDTTKTDTITNLLTYILTGQSRWTVGTVAATRTIYMDIGGSTRLDTINEMMQSIPDYDCVFVQNGQNDWHIDIRLRPTIPECEARLSRNLQSCEISYNAQSIVTRVYAQGLTGGYMDSANTALYGIREEQQSLNESLSAAQKAEIVAAYLANHDHPTISISMSGVELSQVTGLALDAFKIGTVCRVAIPWMGVAENQVIVDKSYPDVLNSPEQVSISLANATPDLSLSVAALKRGGAGTSNTVRKQKNRYETKFEQDEQKFRLIATDTQWDELEHGTVTAYGQLVLTSQGLQTVVTKTGINSLGQNETLYSQIDQNAQAITAKVGIGDVATQLSIECGNVTISGGDLVIDGMITAAWLETTDILVEAIRSSTYLEVGYPNRAFYVSSSGDAEGESITVSGAAECGSLIVDGVDATNMLINASVSGNVLTLTKRDGTTVTFSKATSLSGVWSGRNFTVTASPQGDIEIGTVYDGIVGTGSVTVSGKNVKRDFIVYSEDPDTHDADTIILQKEVTIDASDVYDAGFDAVSTSDYIQLAGSSSVNANVVKSKDGVSGYIWLKRSNGSWERDRSFSVGHVPTYAYHKTSTYSGSVSVKIQYGDNHYRTITSSALADTAWNNLSS